MPGLTPEVVYSTAVIRRLAALAEEGYRKSPLGGEEVGGVLFGTMERGEVRVTASRELPCERARGPGFSLSAADEQTLRELVTVAVTDPELRDLAPVGWYRSRTRSGIGLSADDLGIFNRFFPLAGQLALILRPEAGQPTRAGFFFRPARGLMRTDASYLEFETGSGLNRPDSGEPSVDPEPDQPLPPPRAMLSPAVRRMPRGRLATYAVAGSIAAIAAALGGFVWGRSNAVASHLPPLSLRVVQRQGMLRAEWNPLAPPVARAHTGRLEVRDGKADGKATMSFPLNPVMLRSGSWPLTRQSAEISVRLVVERPGATPVAEVAKFLGRQEANAGTRTASAAPALSPEREREAAALLREIGVDRAVLAGVKAGNDDLERKIAALQLEVNRRVATAKPTTASPPVPPPPVAQNKPPVTQQQPPQANTPAAAPSTPPAETSATAPPLFGDRTVAVVKPIPAAPPPPPDPVRPAYGGPQSGKAIWTGSLAPGATLTIESRRASVGSLNSPLPAAPLRVSILPAEFSSGGLSVYSGQQRHASGNVVEPRSAQNGWQETRYVYNPDRARGVAMAEAPSAANGFKLTLRAGDRPVSVIVIDWQIAQ